MSDYIPVPNVKNVCRFKSSNFVLIIYTYRKLNNIELEKVARFYIANHCHGVFPKNATHKVRFTQEEIHLII